MLARTGARGGGKPRDLWYASPCMANEPRLARRDDVLELLAKERRALHVNEIAMRLGVAAGDYVALHRLLDDLGYDGSVVAQAGQRFRLSSQQVEQRGAALDGFMSVHPRGFGFVSAQGLSD